MHGNLGAKSSRGANLCMLVGILLLFVSIFAPSLMLSALLGVLLILDVVLEIRHWRHTRRTLRALGTAFCANCSYRRTGLPDDRPCPECGTPYDRAKVEHLRSWYGLPVA